MSHVTYPAKATVFVAKEPVSPRAPLPYFESERMLIPFPQVVGCITIPENTASGEYLRVKTVGGSDFVFYASRLDEASRFMASYRQWLNRSAL